MLQFADWYSWSKLLGKALHHGGTETRRKSPIVCLLGKFTSHPRERFWHLNTMSFKAKSGAQLSGTNRAPAEPMPAPIKEPPNPAENPDAPVREPDPEEPGQI